MELGFLRTAGIFGLLFHRRVRKLAHFQMLTIRYKNVCSMFLMSLIRNPSPVRPLFASSVRNSRNFYKRSLSFLTSIRKFKMLVYKVCSCCESCF